MKLSKKQVIARYRCIPKVEFEQQTMTSFAGLIVVQALMKKLRLMNRLHECWAHRQENTAYGLHRIALGIVLHLLLGYRSLREAMYYREDPLVLRTLGLRSLPNVSTVSRGLKSADGRGVEKMRGLCRRMVLEDLRRHEIGRVTLDFDGSVQSTKGHAEGTAVGYNKKKKGARSYYPLYCTANNTQQILDVLHRPGNVHDSNGAEKFIGECVDEVQGGIPGVRVESRLDSAFFSDGVVTQFEEKKVKYSISVPFERFTALKHLIEARKRWRSVDDEWSYFEMKWKPKSWGQRRRFVFLRKKTRRQNKAPIQLDLFVPVDECYEYKVVVTNMRASAKAVVAFHNGRGAQEAMFADAKQDVSLGHVAVRTRAGNQVYTLAGMIAHNLSRSLQMLSHPPRKTTLSKRPANWTFEKLDTLRHKLLCRAGRLVQPGRTLTLIIGGNDAVRKETQELLRSIEALPEAA